MAWNKPTSNTVDATSSSRSDVATRLKQLDALKSQGLITEAEYAAQRTKIISEI